MVKKVHASRVVAFAKICKKAIFIMKLLGVLGLPFCCFGLVCLAYNVNNGNDIGYIYKVVAMYGEEVLNKLAPLVAKEHALFLRACREVNEGVDITIYPNVTLLDALRVGMPSVGCVIQSVDYDYLGYVNGGGCVAVKSKNEYLGLVYKKYIELGGKVEVVVYGLAEYVAIIHDVGDISVRNGFGDASGIEYFKRISGATQLNELVMSYKDKVDI